MSAARRADGAAAAVEVVPNGQALAIVRSWLPAPADGDEDYDAMLDWGEQPEQDEPQRPARLGLGAKFLSHARAAALMDPLERRMQRQLGANRAARLAVDKDEPAAARSGGGGILSAATGAGRNESFGRGRGDRFAAAAEPAHVHAQEAAESDEEEEERSFSFKRRRVEAPAQPLSAKQRKKLRLAKQRTG